LPNVKRANELGYEEFARQCLQTAKQYLDKHPHEKYVSHQDQLRFHSTR